MDLTLSASQRAFRQEVRQFLRAHLSAKVLRRSRRSFEHHDPEFYARLAERGWLGLDWPREYGGQGRSPVDVLILVEELGYAGAPVGRYIGSVVLVGNTLLAAGSEAQRRAYLPRLARGQLLSSLAVTEPDAGSDAAAVSTRAEPRDGDYILNGEKVFISGAHLADDVLMLVRTDASQPSKYRGLSLLLVPMSSPGITLEPIWTVAGFRVDRILLRDVRIRRELLVGPENDGWNCISKTFGFERTIVGALHLGRAWGIYHTIARLARDRSAPERLPGGAFDRLVDLRADLEAARLTNYHAAWLRETGQPLSLEASVAKVQSGEITSRLVELGMDLFGTESLLGSGPLWGVLERAYRAMQFQVTAGGTNDIQRNILAVRGLGLPH